MKNEMQLAQQQVVAAIDPKAVVAQVKAVQQIMQDVMKEGTHYGVIPGCQQPTLYKAGSETLLSAFRISVEPEVEEIRESDGHITYRVRAVGRHMQTGIVVGVGVGECSTSEEKYAWRTAVCQEEFDATPDDRRRTKYGKKRDGGYYTAMQIRTNARDLSNTALKMAKKRAQIDLTLTATACSDIFTQDIEDLDESLRGFDGDEPQRQKPKPQNKFQPKPKSGEVNGGTQTKNETPISEAQQRMLKARMSANGVDESVVLARFQAGTLAELKMWQMNDAITAAEGKA